jgi:hypothetical protein
MLTLVERTFEAIGIALSLSPGLLRLATDPGGLNRVALAVAGLGGASLLLGESVVLFLNRVPPVRFALSLLLNGMIFAGELTVWAATIWWLGTWGLGADVTLSTMVNLVALGAAPFVFGFLVLAPYMGPAIARVLWVWSLLITVRAVAFGLGTGIALAAAMAGLGWLLVLGLSRTLGRPVIRARNLAWESLVGPRTHTHARDILELAMAATDVPAPAPPPPHERGP